MARRTKFAHILIEEEVANDFKKLREDLDTTSTDLLAEFMGNSTSRKRRLHQNNEVSW